MFKKYDSLKGRIIMTLRDWSKARAKYIARETKKLRQKILEYTCIIEDGSQKQRWQETARLLLKARKRLAEICQEIAKGAWIRSRAKWDFEGDKCTKMYFNLEKKYSARKSVTQIKRADGTITKDPLTIIEEFKSFYKQLYTHRPIQEHALDKLLAGTTLKTELLQSKKMKKMLS